MSEEIAQGPCTVTISREARTHTLYYRPSTLINQLPCPNKQDTSCSTAFLVHKYISSQHIIKQCNARISASWTINFNNGSCVCSKLDLCTQQKLYRFALLCITSSQRYMYLYWSNLHWDCTWNRSRRWSRFAINSFIGGTYETSSQEGGQCEVGSFSPQFHTKKDRLSFFRNPMHLQEELTCYLNKLISGWSSKFIWCKVQTLLM